MADHDYSTDEPDDDFDAVVSGGPFPTVFPDDLVDIDGRAITPGMFVSVLAGEAVGESGPVHDWAGGDRIRFEAAAVDGDDFGPLVVVRSTQVAVMERPTRPADLGRFPIESPRQIPTVMVVPVGSRDIQQVQAHDQGPFPPASDFTSERPGGRTAVDAGRWGRACLDALAGYTEDEADALVGRHLRAPMLERAIEESAIPRTLDRLLLVVTDQADELRGRSEHPDDTRSFGELLTRWVRGTADRRFREVVEIADPVVLTSQPHVQHAVLHFLRMHVARIVDGMGQVVIVHAGGTPAMTSGATLAFATAGFGVPIRMVQPVESGPLLEVRFPALVPAADVAALAMDMDAAGETGAADRLRSLLGSQH
jgi:hypothetical protein